MASEERMNSSIILISNPIARRGSLNRFEAASSFLQEKGYETKLLLTQTSGDAIRLARESVEKEPYAIIAAGGDGTINEVTNGMAGSGVPLGILPLGTTNVLAKELGIPEEIRSALEVAVSREPKTVSLGRIELNSDTDSAYARYFCLMAGIGFDAQAVHDVNYLLKKKWGKAAYILSGIKTFLQYSPDQLFYQIDGKEYTGYASITGKAAKYGGNFRVTPDAKLPEPELFTCIFRGRKRTDLLRYVFKVVTGRHLLEHDVIYLKSESITVLGSAHVQVDGDYLGLTPAKITVAKDALRIIY
jgi:diacylglycerol kinase (ATP)